MHRLTFIVEVSEEDPAIEKEIARKLQGIFVEVTSMLDYVADNFATSIIVSED